MRLRLVAGVGVIFVVVTIILTVVLFGSGLMTSVALSRTNTTSAQNVSSQATTAKNVIINENTHLGTDSWRIPVSKVATTEIQAYTSATSVSPGQNISFFVSTQQDNTHYWIDIYRLGWYQGYGGRLMTSISPQVGHSQGYDDSVNHRLVNCTSCYITKNTGLIEARWNPSYTLTVSTSWVTGIYLAYQAYNDWGGASLYDPDNGLTGESNTSARAVKVSFERPYTQGDGTSQVLVFEADEIHWLEQQGYGLSYMSNVDLQEHPAVLLQHRAYLSLGHDEYWTKEMRDAVVNARDQGVCYHVLTSLHNLKLDPIYGKDKTRLTTQWRDRALALPENTLIGIMYSSLTYKQSGFPWSVSLNANTPLLKDTDLTQGQQYGCGLGGYEWDRIFTNGATPVGLQVIGESNTIDNSNISDSSNTTYYIAPSGSLVFATGSMYWTAALDSYRFTQDPLCSGKPLVVPGMQQLLANVMKELVITHFSHQLTF